MNKYFSKSRRYRFVNLKKDSHVQLTISIRVLINHQTPGPFNPSLRELL